MEFPKWVPIFEYLADWFLFSAADVKASINQSCFMGSIRELSLFKVKYLLLNYI